MSTKYYRDMLDALPPSEQFAPKMQVRGGEGGVTHWFDVNGESMVAVLGWMKAYLLALIKPMLPAEGADTYVDIHTTFCAGIKHVDHEGKLGLYSVQNGEYEPLALDDLPVEALVEFYNDLKFKYESGWMARGVPAKPE